MTDERDKDALEQPQTPPPVEDWAQAFAALEEPAPAGDQPAPDDAGTGPSQPAGGAGPDGTGQPPSEPGSDGSGADVGSDDDGRLAPDTGDAGEGDDFGDPGARIEAITASIDEQATADTLELFLNRADEKGNKLIRQTDGQLGATVNDPDIYRTGPDGLPVFVNPDTGKPFDGADPRGQAQAWVDRYNNELKDTFNKWADARNTELLAEAQPALDTIEFAPVYEKLDPVRKTMFDALVEGHEVIDADGDHIGYDVDLNATLERVNRQVEAIKAQQTTPPAEPTSPALDMPNSGAGTRDGKEIKNVADAMEALEDAKLENARKKG